MTGKRKGGGTLQVQIARLKERCTEKEVEQAIKMAQKLNSNVIKLAFKLIPNDIGLSKAEIKYYNDFAKTDPKAADKWKSRKIKEKSSVTIATHLKSEELVEVVL